MQEDVCGLYAKIVQYEETEGLGVHESSEKKSVRETKGSRCALQLV